MISGLDSLPVIDPALRAELEMVGGPELPARLVDMFLTDVPPLLETIDQSCKTGDSTATARAAHRIKGGAAAVGAQRVAAVAKALEFAGRKDRLGDVPGLRPLLDAELATLKAAS
jgi:HPt (histidine-containing phosphotransfer) domain-containing protein